MVFRTRLTCLVVAFVLLVCLWHVAAGEDVPPERVDYGRQVKPLLQKHCFACHGTLKQEAQLRLDSGPLISKGGDSGPAIVPGNSANSLLIGRITATDETRMPREARPLTEKEVALLKAWIDQGATYPADDAPEPDPREHWAFRVPVRPAIPAVGNAAWSQNPIDAFLSAEHERRGLVPSPPAEKSTLLRRVYLDLVGVPPTRQELAAFLADESPDAYEKTVDRLLESPLHGERWARHWMDVWRYSDWYGRRSVPDVMNSYAMIWRWRDWIVRSLNEDKGYDRMVQEMLAADELSPGDDVNVVATGFIVRNWFKWNYNTWMRDQVEHTGKAFLGLTLNCAHCHDHKYDPISQEEYFRFRAFFEPLELRHERVPGEPDPGPFQKYVYAKSYGPISSGLIRVFDEKLDAQTFMYAKGDERNKLAGRPPVAPGVPAALGGRLDIQPIALPVEAYYPGLKSFVQQEELTKARTALAQVEAELAKAQAQAESARPQLQQAVTSAEAAVRAEREKARAEDTARLNTITALAGKQSLLLDARQGRRALACTLPGLKIIDHRTVVSFQVRLIDDAHFNFQLGLNIATGATGAVVIFEKGRVRSYKPGGFEEFDVGSYNFAAGEQAFAVTLAIDPAGNRALLRVQRLADGKLVEGPPLVDNLSVALNGWNPLQKPDQGIFVDSRTGSRVLLDEVTIGPVDGEAEFRADFEPPRYAVDADIAGKEGWKETAFSVAPATSRVVSAIAIDRAPTPAEEALRLARRKLAAQQLLVEAAEAKLAAARAELGSLEARIAADNARYGRAEGDAEALAAAASRAERQAKAAAARAALRSAERQLAEAESQPPDEKQAKQAAAAQKQVAADRAALEAAEKALQAESSAYSPLSPVYPRQSTGRRAALARWITQRENPLTARVAVNHIWNWHFGRPLVETTFNFGRNGKPPSHPELLDWLAVELMDHGWRMKHLHRLIVTSQAYRQRSHLGPAPDPAVRGNLARDPNNRYWWRFSASRMEAEVVRDSLLHVAGDLDLTLGGPDIDYAQGLSSRRRSLYFTHHGESKMEFLELFDVANPCDCYVRTTSVTPQQALALVNSDMTNQLARKLAARLWADVAELAAEVRDAAFARAAFEQVLGRNPTQVEQALSLQFLDKQEAAVRESTAPETKEGHAAPSADARQRAREGLVQALFNHNDFVTVR